MCRHHGYRLCRCRGREHGECHNLLHYAECCCGHSYHIVYEDSDKLERHVDARILQCNGRSGFMDVPRLRPSPPSSSHTAVCPAFWRAPCLSPVSPDRIRGKWLLSCSSACFFRPCGLGHLAVQSWRFAPGGRAPFLPKHIKTLPKRGFCAIEPNVGEVRRFGSIFLRLGLLGHWRLTIICLLCSRKPACAPCWRHCGIKQRIWDFGWTLRRAALCSRSSLTRFICCSTL